MVFFLNFFFFFLWICVCKLWKNIQMHVWKFRCKCEKLPNFSYSWYKEKLWIKEEWSKFPGIREVSVYYNLPFTVQICFQCLFLIFILFYWHMKLIGRDKLLTGHSEDFKLNLATRRSEDSSQMTVFHEWIVAFCVCIVLQAILIVRTGQEINLTINESCRAKSTVTWRHAIQKTC